MPCFLLALTGTHLAVVLADRPLHSVHLARAPRRPSWEYCASAARLDKWYNEQREFTQKRAPGITITYIRSGTTRNLKRGPDPFSTSTRSTLFMATELSIPRREAAGKVGEARYPFNMSDTIQWPPGVGKRGFIEKEHDTYWVEQYGR
ncbi:hypothetical protein EXIGLDRAFT_754110 [Exidia glandulosa HHB12029]|uniref:Uncharacterized protein n=1 Tax=Exidia glandulosa HHB12029 TaxID=1314781 RepID=A0A165D829_EXIGL|nr:hypothetical protein EXIGLDRAFT_754110 [Exidia glandulosa HHB12029]